jgi:hypothetical protein
MASTGWFIDVQITTDETTLADNAVARLEDLWPTWTPNDGDPEVVQIETLAPMAADAAATAARIPSAIFRSFGTKLYGIPYNAATPATAVATFALADTIGHANGIKAGTEFEVGGVAFAVDIDTPVPAGPATIVGVPVTCEEDGEIGNGLTGAGNMLTALSYVSGVTLTTVATDGVEGEDDDGYQDRFSRDLQLRAKTLITPRDYELEALDFPTVGRAIATRDPVGRVTQVTLTNIVDGGVVDTPTKTSILNVYADNRASNWTSAILDATYTVISVAFSVKARDGYDVTDLAARCTAALQGLLNALAWGAPPNQGDAGLGAGRWTLDNTVWKNVLIALLADVDGVQRAVDVTITGSAGAADGSGNWVMPGTVALPTNGTFAATVV